MKSTRSEQAPVAGEEGYWQLVQEGWRSFHDNQVQAAEETLARALRLTSQPAPRRLWRLRDRAYCNWAGVMIARGKGRQVCGDLATLLGASPDLKARQLAAHHLAHFYAFRRLAGPYKLYAGIAHRLARALGDRRSEALGLNQLGIAYLAESRWAEARCSLEEAEQLMAGLPHEPGMQLIRSTLVYALSLTGNLNEARRQLDGTVDSGPLDCPRVYQPEMAINLALACLEMGEPEEAAAWGEAALDGCVGCDPETGPRHADPVDLYAHYAVGEAAARLGRWERARWHFSELQRKHYPRFVELPDLLLAGPSHRFVNWLA